MRILVAEMMRTARDLGVADARRISDADRYHVDAHVKLTDAEKALAEAKDRIARLDAEMTRICAEAGEVYDPSTVLGRHSAAMVPGFLDAQRKEIATLTKERDEASERFAATARELIDVRASLRAEVDAANARAAAAEVQAAELRTVKVVDAPKTALPAYEETVESLRAENKALRATEATTRKERDREASRAIELRNKLFEKNGECKRLEGVVDGAKDELNKQRLRAEAAEGQVGTLRSKLQKAHRDLNAKPRGSDVVWLIEHPTSPLWFGPVVCGNSSGWVPAAQAIRFAREGDAADVRAMAVRHMGMPIEAKVTDHVFNADVAESPKEPAP